jgi:hypothetical protein
MVLGKSADPGKILEIDTHTECMTDVIFPHSCQQFIQPAREIGKIKMTMGIDKHGGTRSKRRKEEMTTTTIIPLIQGYWLMGVS